VKILPLSTLSLGTLTLPELTIDGTLPGPIAQIVVQRVASSRAEHFPDDTRLSFIDAAGRSARLLLREDDAAQLSVALGRMEFHQTAKISVEERGDVVALTFSAGNRVNGIYHLSRRDAANLGMILAGGEPQSGGQ